MAIPLYIVQGAQLNTARARSAARREYEPLPQLVDGDTTDYSLYFIDSEGTAITPIGTPQIKIGEQGSAWITVTTYTSISSGYSFSVSATPCTVGPAIFEVSTVTGSTVRVHAQLPVEIIEGV